MPVIQNPDGSSVREKSGKEFTTRGSKRGIGAGLALGYGLEQQGKRDAKDMGKHAYTLWGRGGGDVGYYGRNFAGASENYVYDWRTGKKMNRAAPDNPDFNKWVDIEPWELKRHTNIQNYLSANQGKTAQDFALQRFKGKGGYRRTGDGVWVNEANEMRDAKTGRVIEGKYAGVNNPYKPGQPTTANSVPTEGINGIPWEQLFDQLFGNGQYRREGVAPDQYGGYTPSWLPDGSSYWS